MYFLAGQMQVGHVRELEDFCCTAQHFKVWENEKEKGGKASLFPLSLSLTHTHSQTHTQATHTLLLSLTAQCKCILSRMQAAARQIA